MSWHLMGAQRVSMQRDGWQKIRSSEKAFIYVFYILVITEMCVYLIARVGFARNACN